jgi:hypothetical protein
MSYSEAMTDRSFSPVMTGLILGTEAFRKQVEMMRT